MPKLTTFRSAVNWKHAIGEFVLIVAGVIVALSGDFRLIGDARLRLALLAYREELEGDLRALERLEQQQGATTSRILERIEPVRVMDDSANFGLDFPATAGALRQDPVARSSARDLWRIHSSRVYYLNRMAEQTRALQQSLIAQLAR